MPSLFLFVFFNSLLDLSGLLCYTHAVRRIPPMGKGDILWTTRKSPAAVAAIDIYHLAIIPVLLGNGTRLFGATDKKIDLEMIRTKKYNGIIEVVYSRRKI